MKCSLTYFLLCLGLIKIILSPTSSGTTRCLVSFLTLQDIPYVSLFCSLREAGTYNNIESLKVLVPLSCFKSCIVRCGCSLFRLNMFFADKRRTERSVRGRDESICSRQGKLLVFVDFIPRLNSLNLLLEHK